MSVGPEAAAAREHEAESSRPLAPGSDAQVSQPQPSLLRPEGGAPRPLPAPGGPGPSWAGVALPLLHVPAPPPWVCVCSSVPREDTGHWIEGPLVVQDDLTSGPSAC